MEGKPYAIITPHAGIKYSGPTAAKVWSRIDVPEVVIIVAPNHYSDGERLAIWPEGSWIIPGHAFKTDSELTMRAWKAMPRLKPSRAAFAHHEHRYAEVILQPQLHLLELVHQRLLGEAHGRRLRLSRVELRAPLQYGSG